MLHSNFQAPDPNGSKEEDIELVFNIYLWFKIRTPCRKALFDPWTFI